MATAHATVDIDDDDIRVTTWSFAHEGEATGPHVHEFDYVVVPVTGGTFTVTDADGTIREMIQRPGSPYRGKAGTNHDVASAAVTAAVFVEVELKA